MDVGDARTIGQRLREIRHWRGKSLRVVAELAGISESYLSRLERGGRQVDRRSLLEALAAALRVAPSEITGQPYPTLMANSIKPLGRGRGGRGGWFWCGRGRARSSRRLGG